MKRVSGVDRRQHYNKKCTFIWKNAELKKKDDHQKEQSKCQKHKANDVHLHYTF